MGKKGPKRQYRRQDVLDVMTNGHADDREPWTSSEIADQMGCSRDVAYDRLRELHTLDEVETKEIGARGRVWWIPRE